ncbi:tRNA processing endoribonuclease [Colletotrichum plurivorum]|uniref:tRNA processing endoribonuclease n=1 Tax=Colletotrichum plurivorum TaxID=2175906 RepID=A0A8H6KFS4_9PEZI|nr:tRNA processing endoribonuclease [Colletotrichum plurivorum]
MEMESRNKGPRACTTCAKAKSRCIPGPERSNKCERTTPNGRISRCHRLRKPCGSQIPAPPRTKRDPKPTKVAELEKRLDELTTQLGATAGGSPGPAIGSGVPATGTAKVSDNQTTSPLPITRGNERKSLRIPISCDHLFAPAEVQTEGASDTSPAASSSTLDDHAVGSSSHGHSQPDAPGALPAVGSAWPLNNDSDVLLQTFRDDLQPLYPFVIVPPHMSPAQLARERPYLWKGIMMTACHLDATRQVTLGNELLQDIVQAAFTKPRKSLDVLQGLQLLIAWYHYNINSFQLTNLLFLARSMCISLGFKESPLSIKGKDKRILINLPSPGTEAATPALSPARLELLRAFAGCYYLNTLVFTTNKRPDAFMDTTYLESCCRQIQESAEYPSDELLVQLFKIQQLAQSISLTLGAESTSFQTQLPLTLVVQSFQQQLEIFKTALPEHLKDNAGLLTHISIAEILLYEIGIPESQGPASYISLTERLDLLWGCCMASKTFLERRFPKNNRSVQPRFTCLSSSDFLYVFIVSLKLMTLEVPGWDLSVIRKHLDLASVVESQVQHLEIFTLKRARRPSAAATAGIDAGGAADVPGPKVVDPFVRLTEMLGYFKELVKGELSSFKTQPAIQEPIQLPANMSDGTQAMIRDLDASFSSFWPSLMDDDPSTWDVGGMFPAMDWTAT